MMSVETFRYTEAEADVLAGKNSDDPEIDCNVRKREPHEHGIPLEILPSNSNRKQSDEHPLNTCSITATNCKENDDCDSSHKLCLTRDDGESVVTSNKKTMIYKLTDSPPLHFLLFFALQQSFLVISTPLSTTVVVSQVVCAQSDDDLKIRLLSATFFMMGLSTFAMTTFGVRLPIFQGPNPGYIIPLLILQTLDEFKCPETFSAIDPVDNTTRLMAKLDNGTVIPNRDISLLRINSYGGALIVVGVIHFLIGATGAVGLIARLVGPITIVPIVLLYGIYIHTVVVSFAETHWPTALLTSGCIVIFSLYLEHHDTPIPTWTPSKGFRIVWQPLHRIFAILLSIILGWTTCALLTVTGNLSDDEESKEYLSRTDARFSVVEKSDWIIFPYPGQFGLPGFSIAVFVPFLINCILSVLDSIGDYNASARVTSTAPPPPYAMNRGIAVEGIMSVLSGALGCSHATVSFGENIGAMGISRVASRSVFQLTGIVYVIFALCGKFGAFFITIPYSVIGGTQIITFGILIGVILSYLENIDLQSQRNMSILGIAIIMGMMMPYWVSKNSPAIKTGAEEVDNIIKMLLSNPSFVSGFIACFLDNTVPGTARERGIIVPSADSESKSQFLQNASRFENFVDVYRLPWLPDSFRRSKLAKFIPLFDSPHGI